MGSFLQEDIEDAYSPKLDDFKRVEFALSAAGYRHYLLKMGSGVIDTLNAKISERIRRKVEWGYGEYFISKNNILKVQTILKSISFQNKVRLALEKNGQWSTLLVWNNKLDKAERFQQAI